MSDLRLGVIGAGYIARKHLEVINDIKGITVVAVSHQKSVIDIADQVYKLENGRFVELR